MSVGLRAPFIESLVRAAAALVLALLSVPAQAQGGPTNTQGSISGTLDAQQMDWRLILRDADTQADQIGASLRLDRDHAGRYVSLQLNAIPRDGMSPAGMLRSNGFLRVELFYDLPSGAGLADLVGLQPLEAGVSFVETWPRHIERPALQFSSMFMPVTARLNELSVDGGGGHMAGYAQGRLCLFAYHTDQRGDAVISEAWVLGTQPCVDFQIDFETNFILLD